MNKILSFTSNVAKSDTIIFEQVPEMKNSKQGIIKVRDKT